MQMTLRAAKGGFLDRKIVMEAIGKANAAVLAKQGAYVRTVAKRLMKKAKGASKPGEPPHEHLGYLDKLMFFAFDSHTKTVVVGPTRLSGRDGKVPRTLEHGGPVVIKGVLDYRGRFKPLYLLPKEVRLAALSSGRYVTKTVIIKPRPYMLPALMIAKSKLTGFWENAIRK